MFEATPISLDQIKATANEMLHKGYRFLTQSVVDLGEEGFDVIYHYDRELAMLHYRVKVERGATIPSISDIYFAAMLVENENRDMFGLSYDGLVVDFNRTLYLEESGDPITAPFCRISTFTKLKCEA